MPKGGKQGVSVPAQKTLSPITTQSLNTANTSINNYTKEFLSEEVTQREGRS